jgi:predicted permease
MRPADRDLDEEIRGHLALSVKERIEQGEDPEAARLAALREFGYIPQMRDAMRGVWHSRWLDLASDFSQDIRVGLRSLRRAKGLAATVVVTLALGIGANTAVFSVVRGVLLRPLVNRGEDRLIYIRQSAPGLEVGNMTFSVPEITDFRSRATTIAAFGEFSTIDFTMIGLNEPRVVHAGVVNGEYFDVMGLRPVFGRLITSADDGPDAAGVAVLTYRFWSSQLARDAGVVGRIITLGAREVRIVGVLEPSVPYPDDTEIIANIVTSPHHLGATMVKERTHRMTELFGRLAPDASIGAARAEIASIHAGMKREHPEAYSPNAGVGVSVAPLREQIASPARTVLLVLLAASAVVFVIACSNVANLILARSVRREGELAVRAALGASRGALRRTLLAESLVLCGAGAALGVALARPLVALVARFAARFSVRALDVTIDPAMLWLGAGLAMAAAVVLAYVPRLPAQHSVTGVGVASGSVRLTAGTSRRLRVFATIQIAFSFVLLAGAATLVATLISLQRTSTGYEMQNVLAIDLPLPRLGFSSVQELDSYEEMTRRIGDLPGVVGVALGNFVPWRDADGTFGASSAFAADGYTPAAGEGAPRARLRIVGPGFFDVMGIRLAAGRGFTAADRRDSEPVVVVSETIAHRLYPDGDAINHTVWWTDPYFGKPVPRRIIGVVADVDDEHVVPEPAPIIYHPLQQMRVAGRLFVRAESDPYALVEAVTRIVRAMTANQPVERAATRADVRADVLSPERLNAFVFSGFAGVALLIAVVGVGGVLAFGVSARTREFGVRLAVGSSPRHLLLGVLSEGAAIVAVGIAAGAAGGYGFARLAAKYFANLQLPGALPIATAAAVLTAAALLASLLPAARASRVDVLQALRAE